MHLRKKQVSPQMSALFLSFWRQKHKVFRSLLTPSEDTHLLAVWHMHPSPQTKLLLVDRRNKCSPDNTHALFLSMKSCHFPLNIFKLNLKSVLD